MLRLFVVGFLSLCFCAAGSIRADQNDHDAVTERLQAFSESLATGNMQNLASLLSEDAHLTNPLTDEEVEGRNAIVDYIKERLPALKGKKVVLNITKIDFSQPDEATALTSLQIFEQDKLVEKKVRKIELDKVNGQWYLSSIKEADIEAPLAPSETLKSLDWLIGNWKDEDDDQDSSITFSTKWDKNKNFIIQDFKIAILEEEDLEGKQIIGWDPIEKKIRSWIFDSDGGFGTAEWTKVDNSWNADLTYTLSDGRRGSAVNIYTPIDATSYSYASVGRDVDGEILPDIEAVTVVKEK